MLRKLNAGFLRPSKFIGYRLTAGNNRSSVSLLIMGYHFLKGKHMVLHCPVMHLSQGIND